MLQSKIKKDTTFTDYVLFIFVIIIVNILAFSKGYSYAVTDGIKLWAISVLPAVFPYLFISSLFLVMPLSGKVSGFFYPLSKRLFKTGKASTYAFFISSVSGYPVGAKTVLELKDGGYINKEESTRLFSICSVSSPVFAISSVGRGMFNSQKFGVCLFLCNFLSSILVGIAFSFYKRKSDISNKDFVIYKKEDAFFTGINEATLSALSIGGIITIFYLFTEILFDTGILSPLVSLLTLICKNKNTAQALVFGLFENTKGISMISNLKIKNSLPISSMLCGFGGVSVIMQSLGFIKKAKIKTATFIFGKIIQAVFGFMLGLIFNCFL